MKKLLFIVLVLCQFACAKVNPNLDNNLWKAICKVESNYNQRAIGDKGAAFGIAQIHMGVVNDCNRIIGRKEFTSKDRFNPNRSKQMWQIYLNYYVPRGTKEQLARAWNGGVGNMNKRCTAQYWSKVRKALR